MYTKLYVPKACTVYSSTELNKAGRMFRIFETATVMVGNDLFAN